MEVFTIVTTCILSLIIGFFIGKFAFIFSAEAGEIHVKLNEEKNTVKYQIELDQEVILGKKSYVLCKIIKK